MTDDPVSPLEAGRARPHPVQSGQAERAIGRRAFLRRTIWGLALGGAVLPEAVVGRPPSKDRRTRSPRRRTHATARSMQMPATLQARAFRSSSGDDARYHALVHERGGAAGKALLTTPVSDREVAERLRQLGAQDGGGVPMAAWNLRRLPLVRAPRTRVAGTPLQILIDWEGWDSPRDISSLLRDPGGRGVAFRFGGNEEHDPHWDSGCIACLFSCPGGVVSNERYTIQDHVREATRFSPELDLPEGDTPVIVTIELLG